MPGNRAITFCFPKKIHLAPTCCPTITDNVVYLRRAVHAVSPGHHDLLAVDEAAPGAEPGHGHRRPLSPRSGEKVVGEGPVRGRVGQLSSHAAERHHRCCVDQHLLCGLMFVILPAACGNVFPGIWFLFFMFFKPAYSR